MSVHRLVRPNLASGTAQPLTCADGVTTKVNKIRIQAPSTNSDSVYLCDSSAGTETTAWAEIRPGATEWLGDEAQANPWYVSNIFVVKKGTGDTTDTVMGIAVVR
jgi:hypothetical protein